MTIKAKEELEFVKSHLTGFTAEEQPDGESRDSTACYAYYRRSGPMQTLLMKKMRVGLIIYISH